MIKFYPPPTFNKDDVFPEFEEIFSNGVYTNNGPKVKQLEQTLSEYSSAHAIAVTNGTIAMQLALKALKISGEVITTPFSFVATTSAIISENCAPVFADIDPQTLCIDVEKIREKITEKTSAILAVHMFGNVCNVPAIETLAREYNLKIIYDAAHTFGTLFNGMPAVSYGDCATLSMHAYKILSSAEGGAVFCRNSEIFNQLFEIRYFGKDFENTDRQAGINAKMNEFNAALAIVSLKHVDNEIKRRKEISTFYHQHLREIPFLSLQKLQTGVDSNCSFFPIILESSGKATKLLDAGKRAGIEFRKYFYPSLNKLPYLQKTYSCPIAENLCERVVCLPMGSHLSNEDLKSITSEILGVA